MQKTIHEQAALNPDRRITAPFTNPAGRFKDK